MELKEVALEAEQPGALIDQKLKAIADDLNDTVEQQQHVSGFHFVLQFVSKSSEMKERNIF